MVNYQDGKIYKIVCRLTGLTYVGATTNKHLCNRLASHVYSSKTGKNSTTSRLIIKGGDFYIELIELVQCNTKDELTKRERYWIENIECVNKQIVGRTTKEYREQHKENHQEYMKVYYAANRQRFLDRSLQQRNETRKTIN